MSRNRLLIGFMCCLALAPFAVVGAATADRDFTLDARVTLDAYQAAVEARLEGVLAATRTLATSEEVRSGQWARMSGPVVSKSTGHRALIVASPVLVDGKVAGAVGVSMDATKLAASLEQAIRFPADVVFYALDEQGQTALHRAGELIFVFPSDVGSSTLSDAVETMLSRPAGVVHYRYAGSERTALFQRSQLTGWVFVLGKSHPPGVKP